jgi:hypothetical protein
MSPWLGLGSNSHGADVSIPQYFDNIEQISATHQGIGGFVCSREAGDGQNGNWQEHLHATEEDHKKLIAHVMDKGPQEKNKWASGYGSAWDAWEFSNGSWSFAWQKRPGTELYMTLPGQ